MRTFTVQCAFPQYYANIVTVEAETAEEAFEKALEEANGDDQWKAVDNWVGDTFVTTACAGTDERDLYNEHMLDIPPACRENAERMREALQAFLAWVDSVDVADADDLDRAVTLARAVLGNGS